MNNYNKLKEVIQKANPEIMELKFECEVNVPLIAKRTGSKEYKGTIAGYNGTSYLIQFGGHKMIEQGIEDTTEENFHSIFSEKLVRDKTKLDKCNAWKLKKLEIIGRPIRLADVLLVLNKDKNNMFNVLIMPDGNFGCFGLGKFRDRQFGWNLKDDNLDNQSDEVKEFLIKLLVE